MQKKNTLKKPTIKDVAQEAGVSIATVSRVVNSNYFVSPDIELRVRKAITKTGYIPSSIARSMKSSTTFLIGLIVSDISNQHFTAMARAIEEIISAQNYYLIVCSTENDEVLEKTYIEALISTNIAGIILNTTGRNDEYISSVSKDTPITLVYRRIQNLNFRGDQITTNNRQSAYELSLFVLKKGHEKIGILNGYPNISTSEERLQGCAKAFKEAGVELKTEYIVYGDFTQQSGYKAAERLMTLPEPPTAIIALNNATTLGALKYLRIHSIRVPEDVSIVCYGDIDDIDLMYIQPTLMTQNPRVTGTKAAELILDRIKDNTISNREVIFESRLCPGNSVAEPAASDRPTARP